MNIDEIIAQAQQDLGITFNTNDSVIEEQSVNNTTTRDLDAEENADWENRIRRDYSYNEELSNTPNSSLSDEVAEEVVNYTNGRVIIPANQFIDTVREEIRQIEHNTELPNGLINQIEQSRVITPESFNTEDIANTFREMVELDTEPHTMDADIVNGIINVSESSTQVNSETAAIDNTIKVTENQFKDEVSRFRGAPWFEVVQEQTITLAGLGGIGSYAAFFLSRIKPKAIAVYDADAIESVNLSGQLFSNSNIGQTKVDTVVQFARDYSNYQDMFSFSEFFTEESEASNIMICGFDSMKSRQIFYNAWKKHISNKTEEERKLCLFIDGRLSAENLQVFCITGDDIHSQKQYETEWLFTDEEAETVVCSYKQTTYCAAMISSLITNLFINFCTNLTEPDFPRSIPFMTSYDAGLMLFKIE